MRWCLRCKQNKNGTISLKWEKMKYKQKSTPLTITLLSPNYMSSQYMDTN